MSAPMNMQLFKPGERIAVPILPIAKIENGVAVLKKTRIVAQDGCGARHVARVESPFLIRGGFRVEQTVAYKIPPSALEIRYRYRSSSTADVYTINLPRRAYYISQLDDMLHRARRMLRLEGIENVEIVDVKLVKDVVPETVFMRRFRHAEVLIPQNDYFIHINRFDGNDAGDTYFVYEFINSSEAKLVDDTSRIDYVLLMFGHQLTSRAGCAEIRLLNGDVAWHDIKRTCCRITSVALAMVVARYGSRVAVAKNDTPYRGCCEEWIVEEWESAFPPRRVTSYRSTDPVASNTTPEDVV
jgi:hypothetical protein